MAETQHDMKLNRSREPRPNEGQCTGKIDIDIDQLYK